MPNEQKLRALLADLGKSTLRGVRRCPKCGTLNGIRGLSCKNKACDVVFKEAGEKRKHSSEVCKIVTGTTTQIFSVRVRDKGPDYRGFVQLPVLQPSAADTVTALIIEATALCFVDTCQRTFNTNVLKCHEKDIPVDTSCQHIQAALRCYAEAQPLNLSNSVVASLKIPASIKQAIWQLAIEAVGPVVQRVSKTVMVVKCKVTSKHPLGYLHVSFYLARNKESQSHYICGCPMYKGHLKNGSHSDDVLHRRCIHYYACIAAFVDDRKLAQEFAYFIELEQPLDILTLHLDNHSQEKDDEIVIEEKITTQSQNRLVAILNNVADYCKVEMEVLPEEPEDMLSLALPDQIAQDEEYQSPVDELPSGHDGHINLQELEVIHDLDTASDSQIETTTIVVDQNCLNEVLKLAQNKVTGTHRGNGKQLLSSPELPCLKRKRDDVQKFLQECSKKLPRKQRNLTVKTQVKELDESSVSQTFIQWLASVTERINQTMHFQFSGKPPPLVFHAPQDFFDCLRERISFGGRKKRLPNETTAFIRRDSLPVGTFTKYTWRINNIIHCKQIFETSLVPLAITRSFVENRDGTYDPYEAISQKDEAYSKMDNAPHIRPLELKTFLKVGHTLPDQQNPTPLIIEWTPDILPISRVGELKITFEFGHQRP